MEPRWFVTSVAASIDADHFVNGTTFGLLIDDQPLELDVRDGMLAARHGDPEQPTVRLTGSLRDFFAAAKGRPSPARRIAVEGDLAAGKEFLEALTGCLMEAETRARSAV